jgi:hypothetical protein
MAHLNVPPPITRVDLIIHTSVARVTRIMPLGSKRHVLRKLGIAVKRAYAFDHIPGIEFQGVAVNRKLLASKRWAAW